MPAGGLVVAGALGLGQAAMGFINAGKANREAELLRKTRPKLSGSSYLQDDLRMAESELANPMSAEASMAYETDMDKTLSSSLGTITRLGGSPNSVGEILANSDAARGRLAMMKDNLRFAKIDRLSRARQASEEEREKEFEFNEWMPWADDAQANAAAKAAAQSEIYSGLNTAGAGAMRFGQQQASASQFEKYFKTTTPAAPQATSTPPPSGPTTNFLTNLLSEGSATSYLY